VKAEIVRGGFFLMPVPLTGCGHGVRWKWLNAGKTISMRVRMADELP
jgi:hypothetical protein